jgi:hypothetical protein
MKYITLLVAILLSCSIGTHAQNAFFDAKYVAGFDPRWLSSVEDSADGQYVKYSISYNKIEYNEKLKKEISNSFPISLHLSEDENKALRNFKAFLASPFDKGIQPIDVARIRTAVEKLRVAQQNKLELENNGTYKEAKAVGTAALAGLSAVLGLIPQLNGGAGKGLSVSKEQQSVIIDGIARYYAAEFKKAQTLSYMRILTKMLEKYPDMKVFFPETINKLQNTDPSRFPELGDEYKDIFSKDLKAILKNVTAYVDEYKELNKKSTDATVLNLLKNNYVAGNRLLTQAHMDQILASDYYLALRVTTDIGDKMLNKYPLADLFTYLYNTYKDETSAKPLDKAICYTIKSMNAVQFNLRDTTEGKTWLTLNELQALSTNEKKFFAALMYQNYKNELNLPDISNQIAYTDSVWAQVNTLAQALVEVQELRNTYKNKDRHAGEIQRSAEPERAERPETLYTASKVCRLHVQQPAKRRLCQRNLL